MRSLKLFGMSLEVQNKGGVGGLKKNVCQHDRDQVESSMSGEQYGHNELPSGWWENPLFSTGSVFLCMTSADMKGGQQTFLPMWIQKKLKGSSWCVFQESLADCVKLTNLAAATKTDLVCGVTVSHQVMGVGENIHRKLVWF